MGRGLLRAIRVMNAISMLLFVVLCIHSLSHHTKADNNYEGALTIVATEDVVNNGKCNLVMITNVHVFCDELK